MPHGVPRVGAVVDLPPHRHAARLVEQRVGIAAHHQQRHQVLEQRRAPRQQHRRAAHARDQPAEVEPVHLGHVALGDGDEAGQPRLRRQQVVERRVEAAARRRRRRADSRSRTAGAACRRGTGSSCRRRRRVARAASDFERARVVAAAGLGGSVASARSPDASVSSAPARLPLSTVETYARRQRRQRARVVPVQQVALEVLEPLDRGQRRVEPRDQRRRCR